MTECPTIASHDDLDSWQDSWRVWATEKALALVTSENQYFHGRSLESVALEVLHCNFALPLAQDGVA